MPRMHPEEIDGYELATEGEQKVFRFLREAAKPHKDFTCWYQPTLGSSGKEPDFILFGAKLGLLILEVKDWYSRQIVSYNPHQFTIYVSGKTEIKTNPDKQAKGYVNSLKDRLSGVPEFLSRLPAHKGELKIPIGRMVVFPNITTDEYADSDFKWAMEPGRVLLKEDLDSAGDLLRDTSGQKFTEKFLKALPFTAAEELTPKEVEKLHFILWPEGKIDLPIRQGTGREHFQRGVATLDHAQAKLASRLGSGHRVIKGPPGSGKTLVLVHRCCHIHKSKRRPKEILLVCFNIALVSYLKRLVQQKGVGIGDGGIHVYHFFDLCSKILGEDVDFQNPDQEYYAFVAQEALGKVANGGSCVGPFDAILVDEGQDFDEDMLRVLLSLLRPGGDLVISRDSYQALYGRRPGWKSLGIKTEGRTHHLKNAYRCTAEIFDFTQRFIGQSPGDGRQQAILPPDFGFHGERPSLLKLPGNGEVENFVVKDILEVIREGEYKRSEIAIIYDDKVYSPDGFTYDSRILPERLFRKLEASGIPAYWVSQDVRAKQLYDITTDRVSLISVHSSKGLDYDLVYLVGMDHIIPNDATRQKLITLIYVAMTRAKYRLVIPFAEETELVARMKECL